MISACECITLGGSMKIKFTVLYCLFGAVLTPVVNGSSEFHQISYMKMKSLIQPPSGSTLLLGRGFNSVNGTVGGPCVEAGETIKSAPSHSNSQKVNYAMQEVQSLEDLQGQLDINFSGSLGLGVWSADLKSKYYRNNTYNSNHYYLLLRVTVENQTEILKNYKLSPSAVDLYTRQGKEAFLMACGDQFVAAQVTGGEFIAILEIEAHSSDEKQTISTLLNASGLNWSAGPQVSTLLTEISKRNRISMTLFRAGDSGALPPQDPQKLIEYALSFPAKVLNQSGGAWPFIINTESYDAILDKPSSDFIHLDAQQHVIAELAQAQEKAKSIINEIEYVLTHQDQFMNPDLMSLRTIQTALKSTLHDIQESAYHCASDLIRGCKFPVLNWPQFTLPSHRTVTSTPVSESITNTDSTSNDGGPANSSSNFDDFGNLSR